MGNVYTTFLLIFFTAQPMARAHSVNFTQDSFDEAKSAINFIKFEMKATKALLFTSEFDGFAKKFSISYELDGRNVKTARITIPVDQLDTGMMDRNETLRTESFNSKKYPDLTVLVFDPIPIDNTEHDIPAILNLRGLNKQVMLKVRARRRERKLIADIHGIVSMKELELPEPSVMLTKVRDQVHLKSHLEASE